MKKELLGAGCLFLALAAISCGSESPSSPSQSNSSEAPSGEAPVSEDYSAPVIDSPEPELPELDLTGQYYTFLNQGVPGTAEPDGNFSERVPDQRIPGGGSGQRRGLQPEPAR